MKTIIDELDEVAYRDHSIYTAISERQLLGVLSAFKLTLKSLMGRCDKKDRDHYEDIIYKRLHSFDKTKGDSK